MHCIVTEIKIDPRAPWGNTMRCTNVDGEVDLTAPYDPEFNIGDHVEIEITKESK